MERVWNQARWLHPGCIWTCQWRTSNTKGMKAEQKFKICQHQPLKSTRDFVGKFLTCDFSTRLKQSHIMDYFGCESSPQNYQNLKNDWEIRLHRNTSVFWWSSISCEIKNKYCVLCFTHASEGQLGSRITFQMDLDYQVAAATIVSLDTERYPTVYHKNYPQHNELQEMPAGLRHLVCNEKIIAECSMDIDTTAWMCLIGAISTQLKQHKLCWQYFTVQRNA